MFKFVFTMLGVMFLSAGVGCVFVGGDVFYASIPFVLHGAVALLLARQN